MQASRRQAFGTTGAAGAAGAGPATVRIAPPHLEREPNERSDCEAIRGGWVSVTPLQPDWTNHAALGAVDFLTQAAPVEVE